MSYIEETGGILMPTQKLRGSDVENAYDARFGGTGFQPEQDPKLSWDIRYDTFRKMERRVPVIADFVSQINFSMKQVTFTFKENEQEETRARRLLGDLMSPRAAVAISRSITHGFSLIEFGFDSDGYINDNWIEIPQNTVHGFLVNRETNKVVGFIQRFHGREIRLPAEFCIYRVDGRGYRGEGLFLNIADFALRFLDNEDRLARARNDNMTRRPNVYTPQDELKSKLGRKMRQAINTVNYPTQKRFVLPSEPYESLGNDGGLTFAQQSARFRLEYLDEINVKQNDSRDYYTREIALVLGMAADTLGANREGSKALAEVQRQSFENILKGAMKEYEKALNDVIKRIYAMKRWRNAPLLSVDAELMPNPRLQAEVLQMLSSAGIMLGSPQGQQIMESLLLTTDVDEEPRRRVVDGNADIQ